jgi:radical SAM protein with 4Fe4S-binding SPASM domain
MATFQAPTDTDLLKVFKFFIKSFPKIHPIADWLKNDKNFMSCRTSKLVLQDGTICLCGNLVQEEKVIKLYKSKIETNSNENIENSFLKKYNCASCEYFDRCTMGCFMQHDYKFREELDECVYKLTHKYIEDENLRIV